MAQGYFGSICLEDLFTGQIAVGKNGKHYICVEDLKGGAFNKSEKNGKTYIGIGFWANDEPDQYQNIGGISLQQSLSERETQQKKQYIGNMKFAQAKGTAASPGTATQQPVAGNAMDKAVTAPEEISDLPF
jgi:hypothetical protein